MFLSFVPFIDKFSLWDHHGCQVTGKSEWSIITELCIQELATLENPVVTQCIMKYEYQMKSTTLFSQQGIFIPQYFWEKKSPTADVFVSFEYSTVMFYVMWSAIRDLTYLHHKHHLHQYPQLLENISQVFNRYHNSPGSYQTSQC